LNNGLQCESPIGGRGGQGLAVQRAKYCGGREFFQDEGY
jgi:hypothetical protein